MMKLLGLAAGAALFATAATAAPVTPTASPIDLTDAVMDDVTAGARKHHRHKSPNTAYADASASALAFGKKTDASAVAYTFVFVTPYSSQASAYSTSYASTN